MTLNGNNIYICEEITRFAIISNDFIWRQINVNMYLTNIFKSSFHAGEQFLRTGPAPTPEFLGAVDLIPTRTVLVTPDLDDVNAE